MLVSWDWLKQYVTLDNGVTADELAARLMMAGLNHEETTPVEGDLAINLEVTSNRPDCLGHIGVAREASVLYGVAHKLPEAKPNEAAAPIGKFASVSLDAPELCERYTARVIRGVRVGPSPAWLVNRLRTIGIPSINNLVDITNYVLMECGQPLHAFDLARLSEQRIIVRQARQGEEFDAINHKTYPLDAGMCVIADASRPVALAGVMGGADTEVSPSTKDVLIESARFDSMAIRATARKLNLHSASSYRFERTLDPAGVDWASRRACQLILELAGGELAAGVLDCGRKPEPRQPVVLRFAQLRRVLGIDIPPERARKILQALGNIERSADSQQVEVTPPSWRADLTREIDLVEEVARIHGYDQIPEDVRVPMATSHRTREDRVLDKVRQVMTACGFDEAMTLSVVDEAWSSAFSPWTEAAPLRTTMPILRSADRLRRSLVPSLLGARKTNESLANPVIELFEIAKVYLPASAALPSEELMLGIASGDDYLAVKGAVEALAAAICPGVHLSFQPVDQPLLDASRSCRIDVELDGRQSVLGLLGQVSTLGRKQFDLRRPATIAEIKLAPLFELANLTTRHAEVPAYPAVERDLNFVVDELVRWADLSGTVKQAAMPHLERLEFIEVYRDPERLGAGKKSLVMKLVLRSAETTLTNEEADRVRNQVEAACRQRHGAELRKT